MKIFPRAGREDDAAVFPSGASGSRLSRTSFLGGLFGAVVAIHTCCAVAAGFAGCYSTAHGAAHLPANASNQKNSIENTERISHDINPGTEYTGPAQQDNSGSSSAAGVAICKREIPAQESFLDKVIRILFRSHGCSRNMETDTSLSAGGAGGG